MGVLPWRRLKLDTRQERWARGSVLDVCGMSLDVEWGGVVGLGGAPESQ